MLEAVPGQRAAIPAPRSAAASEGTPGPADTPGSPAAARRPHFHLLGGALAVVLYAAVRLLGAGALGAYLSSHDGSLFDVLTRADGDWYQRLAENGYDRTVPIGADGLADTTNLAFFPLYPWLIRGLAAVVPADVQVLQVVIAFAAGLVCAAALYAIGAHLHSRRAGILLAVLWGVLPHAVVQTMGYTESLFTALAAWSLYAVLRRNWITAAPLCVLAGLTRPTGLALIAAVCLAALVAVIRDPRKWSAWAAMVIAPLGTLGFIAWVSRRIGRWDAYPYIQGEAWNNTFDGGAGTGRTLGGLLDPEVPLPLIVTTVVLLGSVALCLVAIGARVPWPMLVYVAGILILTIGSGEYYWAKGRLLLPAFPLLLPIAYALARARSLITAPVVLTLLTVFSAWYGIFLLTQWRSSP